MINSPVDIAMIVGVVLLIFGPKKVPELGRALGQGIGNFKKALGDAQDEVASAVKAAEQKPQTAQAEEAPSSPKAAVQKDEHGVYRAPDQAPAKTETEAT